jgi:hypothetical protein
MSTPMKKGIQYTDQELLNARQRSFFYDGSLRVYNVTFANASETFVAKNAKEARIIADEYSFRGMGDLAPLGRVAHVEWMRVQQ